MSLRAGAALLVLLGRVALVGRVAERVGLDLLRLELLEQVVLELVLDDAAQRVLRLLALALGRAWLGLGLGLRLRF